MKNRDLDDGGLERCNAFKFIKNTCFLGAFVLKRLPFNRKFTLDDLLTNVMIYWTTRSIIPSMRFYKENFKSNLDKRVDARYVASWVYYW